MTIIEINTPINKANLSDLIMFAKKWNLEKGREFLVWYHKEIMWRLKWYLSMKLKNKKIQYKINDILIYLTGLNFYKQDNSNISYWDVFIYTDYEWKKEVHFVKNIIEDWEWKLVIAENGKDYWYYWEKDKVFFIW